MQRRKDDVMHRDSKTRRYTSAVIRERELRQPKHTDPESLRRFREKPYQLKYMEKLKQMREMENDRGRDLPGVPAGEGTRGDNSIS